MLKAVLVSNLVYPGGVDPVNNINYNENDNDLRLLYSRVLNLILTVDDDFISDFVPLIAWCLFVINGLLDDDDKVMERLQQSSEDAEELLWHSIDAYERNKWIPGAILYRSKSKYLILKLKSFLNHHHHYTLHHPNYRVERRPYFGLGLVPKHPKSTVMQFFNSELFPILSCRISRMVFDQLNHYGYPGLYLCCGQTYAMTGPVNLCIENSSNNPIFELKGVEDNKLITYEVRREIKHYNEYKFNGFDEYPLCSKIEYYSLGKFGPTTQTNRVLSLPIGNANEDVEILDCVDEQTERHLYSGICYHIMPGIIFIDRSATIFNLEDKVLFYFQSPTALTILEEDQEGKRRRFINGNITVKIEIKSCCLYAPIIK